MTTGLLRATGAAFGAVLVLVVLLPLAALVLATSPGDLARGASHEAFGQAVGLSLGTSALSTLVMVVGGTPLAYWLARRRSRAAAALELALGLPVVIPPAVVGVGLLMAFGRNGLLGPALDGAGLQPGETRTVPLAILAGLEVDVALAVAFALVLVAIASALFAALRLVPRALDRHRGERR